MNATIDRKTNGASPPINHNGVTDVEGFVFSPHPPALSPEKAMAGSVLRQAAYDLRRFRGATSGVERQLYLDAYDWITADDFSWPYSFVNICHLLNLAPESLRQELLTDASLGLFGYLARRGGRAARSFQIFLNRIFTTSSNPIAVDPVPLTHAPH